MRSTSLSPSQLYVFLALALIGCADGEIPPARDAALDGFSAVDGGGDFDSGEPPGDGGGGDGGGDGGRGPVSIFAIQDESRADHVAAGAVVRIEGVILAAVDAFEENGDTLGDVGDVWIADPAGGPFSGLHVYEPEHVGCAGAPLAPGAVVNVEGTVQEFAVPSDMSGRTVTQLAMARVTCVTAGGSSGVVPEVLADASVLTDDAIAEQWEGVLVELSNVEASTDPDRFGTFSLRVGPAVDDDLYRHEGSRRDRFTTLRGIHHYMFGRWALYPRAAADVALGTPRMVEDESGAWGCADGADSDGDLAVDCADSDCVGSPLCAGTRVRVQDVQDLGSAMHPAVSTDVILAGPLVVTAVDTFAEMVGEPYTGTIVVQDGAAADPRFSGIHVFLPTIEACGASLAVGDRVYVAGRYVEYAAPGDTGGALTEIIEGFVSCQAPGAPLAPARIAAPSDLSAAATAEPFEGVLVDVVDVSVTMPAGMFGRFQVSGGVFVDDDFYRVSVAMGDRFARLAGVLTYQFEYQLEPRDAGDVVLAPTERDAAACSNGTDDDGDGQIDCNDLDCCGTTACMPSAALGLSEVLYDAASPGTDDGREWIEIRNAGATAIPLGCYVMGSGAVSYRYSIAQLPPITIPAGGCVVIGGPDCGGAACTADLNFTPDLHNGAGTAAGASGVALFHGLAADVTATSVPVDAVLYGTTNTAMLLDRSGSAPAMAHVADVGAGQSIARSASGMWAAEPTPTPGTCAMFTP